MTVITEGHNALTKAFKLLAHTSASDVGYAEFATPELRTGAAQLTAIGESELAQRILSGAVHLDQVVEGARSLDESVLDAVRVDALAGAELIPRPATIDTGKFHVTVDSRDSVLVVGDGVQMNTFSF